MGRALWLTSAVVAVAAVTAHAQTLDFASAPYGAPAGARASVAVDIDRDGWLDLATANTGTNTVAVLLNRGDGTGFAAPVLLPVGTGPFDIAAGDLNRDGVPDLVVATPDAHAIEVLLLRADGQLASRTVVAAGSEARGLTLADVTRDGLPDLAFTDFARSRAVLMAGNGAGGFGAVLADVAVSARPQGIAAADFNHDGTVDLAVAATGGSTLDLLYRTATGGFARQTIAAGRTLNVLTVADMNADGWDDIAAAATASNVVVVFKGSGSGFAVAGTRAVGSSPRGIAAADFNQDGRPDLAVGNYGSGSATILLGRRDGSVLPDRWGDLPSGSGARAVAAGDFDNDGRLDLTVGAQGISRVWLHENETPFVAPALSFTRQDFFLSREPIAIADFNENGKPDLVTERGVLLDGVTRVVLAEIAGSFVADVDAADYNRDGHQDAMLQRVFFDGGRQTESRLELYHGNGRGQFAFAKNIGNMPADTYGFHTADLDRDGHLDIVAQGQHELLVKRGVGSGTFSESVFARPDVYMIAFELADVTRDGIPDAVVAEYDPFRFLVYPGDGAGNFGAETIAATNTTSYSFKLGDLNHDGWLDIVADQGWSFTVVLARGDGGWMPAVEHPSYIPWDTASGTVLGDFNNDGHLDTLSWGGAMLFGDGRGGLGPPQVFAVEMPYGIAYDWNRDGLLDIVNGGAVVLNERRAVNRPPVANAGPDRAYLYHEQFQDDEWCERTPDPSDPDLHAVTFEWRDEAGTPFSCSFPAKAPGTYTFTMTVRDGRGAEDADTMNVTIAPAPEIVLHWVNYYELTGNWRLEPDAAAASERLFWYPDAGAPKAEAPAAAPASYVDLTFAPDPTQTYKLWVRLKADRNSWANDSVWVQFTGAVGAAGQPVYQIGTNSGLAVNLEECSGCGVSGWGWEDDGWGAVNRNGTLLRFPAGGVQQIRIQVREDGVSVDQVVLSAVAYRTARPGQAKNDTVILKPTQGW
jgi:hypothetical protein